MKHTPPMPYVQAQIRRGKRDALMRSIIAQYGTGSLLDANEQDASVWLVEQLHVLRACEAAPSLSLEQQYLSL